MRADVLAAIALSCSFVTAFPRKRSALEPYAPFTTSCPAQPLVRSADSLNAQEKQYVERRIEKANRALLDWLSKVWECPVAELHDLPTIGIALSGGGPKAGLTTAGALYGLDGRDSNTPVSGLLQATSYLAALSGGTLTLSGMMANDFALISTLKKEFYDTTYQNTFIPALSDIPQIKLDVSNKTAAGYTATLVDLYGRIISFSFFGLPPDGGNGFLWSDVTSQSSFQDYEAPYPILTATDADVAAGQCLPNRTDATWEMAPFEFGSWDPTVDAFYPTKYIGTKSNAESGVCTAGFDNTGFFTAISSNILTNAAFCTTGNYTQQQLNSLSLPIYQTFPADVLVNPYGIIPNPFYQNANVGSIRSQENLYLVDGGDTGQVIPIFPMIQDERNIDVAILVDASSAAPNNISSGASVYNSYTAAQAKGLSRMPIVPTQAQFAAQNLSSHPSFYGCYDESKTTLIYLPDTEETIASAFAYTSEQVQFIFQGGVDQVNAGNSTDWPACLACAIMHKTPWGLPDECEGCLQKYCWNP